MIKTFLLSGLLLQATCAAAGDAGEVRTLEPMPAQSAGGDVPSQMPALRVVDAYTDGGTTKVVIQSAQPLVLGRSLYVGPAEIPVTVDALLARSGGVHYYSASTPGKDRVSRGDVVRFEASTKPTLPQALLRSLRASHGYEQKSVAEITAVQGDRVMIDKGTLHEVHELDLYRIYDGSGSLKGSLEVRGIGDLQSSAKFQLEWKDKKRPAPVVEPGDYALFIGQRRLFGLGLVVGSRLERTQMLYSYDNSAGGGLLWSMTFYNGWGLEALFGYYDRSGKETSSENPNDFNAKASTVDERSAKYIAPIWLKKNFFYPSLVSPFAGAGVYWLDGRHLHQTLGVSGIPVAGETKVDHGVYPVVGAGLEFFPARFFRPRIEVRHFFAPDMTALGNVFRAQSTFYSLGVLTTW